MQDPQVGTPELVHVNMILRHGDRAPTVNLSLGYPKVFYECGLYALKNSTFTGLDIGMLWERLNKFPILPLGEVVHEFLQLHPGTGSYLCGVGQLTALGFLQHIRLGLFVKMKYLDKLHQFQTEDSIYVQSTDFERTVRSAAAFLVGFVGSSKTLPSPVPLHVSPGDLVEAPPPGVQWMHRRCQNLYKLLKEEQKASGYRTEEKEFHWMQEKLIDMFGLKIARSQPIWTKIFDGIKTRGCQALHSADYHTHSLLPCTADRKCIDCDLAKKMFDFADWTWARKYPPNSSFLAILPFLRHSLVEAMDNIVLTTNGRRYNFFLTFAHDTTLQHVLQALGLSVKEWVPYASRLVFELWRTAKKDKAPHFFVRVLLNGDIMTKALPFSRNLELVDYATFRDNLLPTDKIRYLTSLCH